MNDIKIPKISKDNNMADGIKGLVGRKMTRSAKFLGEDVKISKLTVDQVLAIQELAKKSEASDNEGFEILKFVIRSAVEGAGELADTDFSGFPLDELSKLSAEILKFSGIGGDAGK